MPKSVGYVGESGGVPGKRAAGGAGGVSAGGAGDDGYLAKTSVLFPDGEVIDAGIPFFHQAIVIELPVFVAIGAVPLTGYIVKFVFEADSNAMAGEGPEFLFEFIIQFVLPFAGEELNDLLSAVKEFGAVAPFGVGGIGERYFFGVTGIPGVFGQLDFLSGGFSGERRIGRSLFHGESFLMGKGTGA
jgi:hypothetical protein